MGDFDFRSSGKLGEEAKHLHKLCRCVDEIVGQMLRPYDWRLLSPTDSYPLDLYLHRFFSVLLCLQISQFHAKI